MSRRTPSKAHSGPAAHARVFAALGDETRLRLLGRLTSGEPQSIARLTEGSGLTRQAITKHLRVLEKTKLARCVRSGRERHYALDPRPLVELGEYLNQISQTWDDRLAWLKALVEE